jgi:hypothetical protein
MCFVFCRLDRWFWDFVVGSTCLCVFGWYMERRFGTNRIYMASQTRNVAVLECESGARPRTMANGSPERRSSSSN